MNTTDQAEEYFRGAVQSYSSTSGFGFIQPDPDQGFDKLLLLHSKSLRRPEDSLEGGDRVLFSTCRIAAGVLATDVHAELVEEGIAETQAETVDGQVTDFIATRGFGFITLNDRREIFFHVRSLKFSENVLQQGLAVSCSLVNTEKGLQAQNIELRSPSLASPHTTDHLASATLARDARRYDEAARLYEIGMRESPSIQLILSYAAMEKNRHRKADARRIYNEGIRLFPGNAKLREDAGVLAASMRDYRSAITRLNESLQICRRSDQGGEKGVLVWLARTHYEVGGEASLKECVRLYQEALSLFGKGATRLPDLDSLKLNLARVRTQHHRGSLTFNFLASAGFEIVKARLLDRATEGADLIVDLKHPELQEGYGVGRYLLIRCFFKSDISLADLEDFDREILVWSKRGLADEQLALLVVASLPPELQRLISQRIDDRRRLSPALVPVQQTDIETGASPVAVLRAALDRWLYRRDLFATNSPVEGRRFFGRDKPLAELRDSIAAGVPSGIFGLRKVGKTSLLKEAQRRSMEQGDLVIYLDLSRLPSDVSDCRWIYWKLAGGLREQAARLLGGAFRWRLGGEFDDFLDIPSSFPVATAFDSDLTRLLQALRKSPVSARPRVVFLIDEIERILPSSLGKAGFEGFFEFFSYLRGVAQENREFVVTVTGANASICETAQYQGRDNPVFNYFKEVYLQLLEFPECATMLRELGRGMGIRFDPSASERIYDFTGGHPFFTRQFCSFISQQYPARPLIVSRSMVDPLLSQYLSLRSDDFQEIAERLSRDFPDELGICVLLAQEGGTVTRARADVIFSESAGSSVRHLTGYQILQVDPERAYIKISMLSEWLQKRYGRNA
ncbi:MAG: cold shock domain-containing protein [Bryobacteraceae bacterium]